MSALAQRAFSEQWIDAEPREGKVDGAFCMRLRADESRVLANYEPSFGKVSTLAHELGHLLGYEDDYDDSESTVMDYGLSAGLRRLPVPAAEIRSDAGAGPGNSLFDARWLPLDEARRVRAERREAAGTRTDAGLTALLAERPAVWAPVDEELARLTATPRKRVDDPEQWWDDVLSSVGDWLDPLDEILSFARQSR